MPTDYEKVYRQSKHALGSPTREFAAFFNSLDEPCLRVLDIGCGQGRDALLVARLGHQVEGVDASPTGIRDLLAEAAAEGLRVKGYVADIREFEPNGLFDVLLVDRTLHMLHADDRTKVLAGLLKYVAPRGYVLIADERSNICVFEEVLDNDERRWHHELKRKGYLFVRNYE